MEPTITAKETDFKPIIGMLWIALLTAIVVTVIDWKIKQDILRLTDAFYRIYPATLEREDERKTEANRLGDDPTLLRFRGMDNDSGMEEENVPLPLVAENGTVEEVSVTSKRGSNSRTTNNSRRLPKESVDVPLGE